MTIKTKKAHISLKIRKFRVGQLLGFIGVLAISAFLFTKLTSPALAQWWSSQVNGTSWSHRKQLTVTNSSSATLSSGTAIAITIDTQSLYNNNSLKPDCSDLRIVYQDGTNITELTRYIDTTSGTTCATSGSTRVYIQLQAALTSGTSSTYYYLYYGNLHATAPASTDAVFSVGSKTATLVCPFDGSTTCAAGETPSTSTGALRYSGSKSALNFGGVDNGNNVNAGTDSSITDLNKLTIDAWIYPRKIGANGAWIITKANGVNTNGYSLYIQGNSSPYIGFEAGFNGGTNLLTASTNPVIQFNVWQHVAATWDGSTNASNVHFYVNGVETAYAINTNGVGSRTSDSGQNLLVGNISYLNRSFDGEIDEVRISDTIRYTGTFTPSTSPFVRDSHTKLLYHFDENGDDPRNTGKTIDDSGNANHGTITGAAYVGGLVGVDAGTTDTGNIGRGSYAGHEGVMVEEATTNLYPNPSFEAGTYNTGWTAAGSNLTLSQNTTAPYYKFGSNSAKLVASATAISGTSNSYTYNIAGSGTDDLSFYVYDGTSGNVGGTVTSSIVKPVFAGTVQSSATYTNVGGGWWRVSYSGTGSTAEYGVQVQVSKTVYVDGFQLEAESYATTYTDGSLGTGYSWSGTANASTSSRTAADLRYADTGNVTSSDGTVTFWAKPQGFNWDTLVGSSQTRMLFSINQNSTNTTPNSLVIRWSDPNNADQRRINAYLVNGSYTFFDPVGSPWNEITGNGWQMITMTWRAHNDGADTVTVYLGTTQQGTLTSQSISISFTGTTIGIGVERNGNFQSYFNLSDVRILNSALTSTEITSLYNAGLVSHSEDRPVDAFNDTKGQNPTAIWHMDEAQGSTANDASAYNNPLTLTSTTWNTDPGAYPTQRKVSLKFNGTSSVASRAWDSDFDFGTGSFTISGWFKHPSAVTGTDTILARYGSAGYKVYMNSSGYICFDIDSDGTWGSAAYDTACTTTSLADSKWHHFEAVKTGVSTTAVYIDGQLGVSHAIASATGTLNSSATLYIGTDSDGASNYWDGFLDEIMIYPTARTAAQVKTDLADPVSANFGSNPTDPLTNGLVGYWKMDETSWNGTSGEVVDSSGNANHGQSQGTPVASTATGKFGNSGSFTAANSQDVTVPYTSSLNPTSAITLSTWFNTSTSATMSLIQRYTVSGSYPGYALVMKPSYGCGSTNGQLGFWVGDNTSQYVCTTATYNDGSWHHAVGTYDGTTARIFVDGQLQNSGTRTNGLNNTSAALYLGATAGSSSFLTGKLDDIRIYNRAFSPAEVSQLYNWAPGPVGYWKLDDPTNLGTDSSGNSQNLTNTNAVTSQVGKIGQAAHFIRAQSQILEKTDNATLSMPNTNMTITAWVKISTFAKTDTTDTTYSIVSKFDYDANHREYALNYYNDGLGGDHFNFILSANGTTYTSLAAYSFGPPSANTWYFLAAWYDSITGKMYIQVNNGAIDSTTFTGPIFDSTSPFHIGGWAIDSWWDGEIDNLKIYKSALTPTQRVSDFSLGAPAASTQTTVGYWKLDEGYGDTVNNSGFSSSTLNGTRSGATKPSWSNSGKINKALNFGGTTAWVAMASDVSALKITSDLTLSAWINLTNISSAHDIICKYTGTAATSAYCLSTDTSGHLIMNVVNATGPAIVTTTGSRVMSTATWYHVSGVFSSASSVTLYINGAQDTRNTTSIPTTLQDNTTILDIGAENAGSNLMNGLIDEPKIYNYALTANEVKIDYNQGATVVMGSLSTNSSNVASNSSVDSYCPPGQGSTCTAPVGEWKLDENTGTNAYDTSGNSYTASWNGSAPYWSRGKFGSAGKFNGSNAYLDAGNVLNMGTSSWTASAWIKSSGTSFQTIVGKSRAAAEKGRWSILLNDGGNNIECLFTDNSAGNGIVATWTTTAHQDNNWHYVTCVWNRSGNMTLYFDGINETYTDISAYSAMNATTSDYLYVGEYQDSSGIAPNANSYMNGLIDDVRIYNYARTPAQIAWDYNRGAPIAWYKFDECSGATTYNAALNSSGTAAGMNGTITPNTGRTTGTCNSGVSTEMWNGGTSGKYSSSLKFDGAGDYVSIADTDNFTFSNGTSSDRPFSLSAWIKLTSVTSDIVSKGTNSSNLEWSLDTGGGAGTNRLELALYDQSGANQIWAYGTDSIAGFVSTWMHVVGTYDGSGSNTGIKLYINGLPLNLTTATQGTYAYMKNTTGTPIIGAFLPTDNTYKSFGNGQIDDVRIYNYALNATQIKLLYNENSAVRFGP